MWLVLELHPCQKSDNLIKKALKQKRDKLHQIMPMQLLPSVGLHKFAGESSHQEEQEVSATKTTNLKDPTVDTSFLPDKRREEQYKEERRRLEQEWKQQQKALKNQDLEIVYSYWDGSGHWHMMQCKTGNTIGTHLQVSHKGVLRIAVHICGQTIVCQGGLDFPHDLTFYCLIATKARGESQCTLIHMSKTMSHIQEKW